MPKSAYNQSENKEKVFLKKHAYHVLFWSNKNFSWQKKKYKYKYHGQQVNELEIHVTFGT